MKKSNKRAERRHHNARLLKKRFKQEVRSLFPWHGWDREEELQLCRYRARKRLDTNVPCSCHMCGNPRRNEGFASWRGLTFQELRANDAQRDGIEEVEESA